MLETFDTAAQEFLEAFARVPDDALAFRPSGDDYALSGLLIHVAGTLEFYADALAQIVATEFAPLTLTGTPDPNDATLAHDGISPDARAATVGRVKAAHAALAQQVLRLGPGDLERPAPVRFGATAEPLPTSAADILGWTGGHYQEHIPHIDELLTRWRDSR
jgi:hypothetical protein